MNRFRVTKIGLLNFWLYDEEEYDFYGGKLILRGTNGSGKSVTMQSFIPLILDGNKSPDRLDPFGSKERKIEDYIIGDSESIQKEESTAYLYMEVFLESENQYITVGLGFRGRKGRPTESWGFALKDGKRVGKDFFLYKDASNKIPLSKNELRSRLGTVNEFTDTTKDYKSMVNRLLFGFVNLDTYDEFIKLLLQLRSNKLSKEYKPTNLVQVLNTVLQPLTEEDLRPLSEAIEQMNKTKEHVETLERNSKSLKDFLKVYHNYNELILLVKAKNYYQANSEYLKTKSQLDEASKNLEDLKNRFTQKKERFKKVLEEIAVNAENKKQLDNQDLKQKIESLGAVKEEIGKLEVKLEELTKTIEGKEKEKLEIGNKINAYENEIYKLKKEIDTYSIELKDAVDDSYFDEVVFFVDELQENLESAFSFDSIFMSLKSYAEKVQGILFLLEKEQRVLTESEGIRVEFENLVSLYKELEQKLSNQEKNLKDSVLAWEEEFLSVVSNNQYLKLDDSIKKQIFEWMNDYSKDHYMNARMLYLNTARDYQNTIIERILKLEHKRSQKQIELANLQVEYQEIEQKETIELTNLDEETELILQENHIESLPFYKCIEFKEKIDLQIKNRIEALLFDLNLLNAKVIREQDIERIQALKVHLLYLVKSSKKKKNLFQYFDIKLPTDTSISKSDVQGILESISVDSNDIFSIQETGIAKIDVLHSIADKKYQQTYIGYLKRMELKKKQLQELNEKMDVISKEIENIERLIQDNENQKHILAEEAENFPSNEGLIKTQDLIRELESDLSYNDKRQKDLEEKIREVDKRIQDIREDISNRKKGLHIPLNVESYKEVSSALLGLKETLQDLKNTHMKYLNKLELKNSLTERLENILDGIDYFRLDKDDKEKDLNVHMATRDAILELLETKEYKDQKERLLEIEENLAKLSSERDTLMKETARLEGDVVHQEDNLGVLVASLGDFEKRQQIYQEILLREYKLGYVYTEAILDVDKTVKNIIREGSTRKETSLNDAMNQFYSSFNHYRLDLNDYSLKNVTLFADYTTEDEELRKIYEENTRVDVTSMYQGIKLNLIELSNKLESDIEENKYLISKQDRHLFEDILLNTVGDKIRKRIDSSNEWVSKINHIMSKMQENSALSFKLVWKSISADREDEVDTKELVRILKMDPKLLKESDASKLTNHFRSKIKKAEELYQDSYISFYKIIEEVLDYRNWFTFQLLYQRKGMDFKELTDKTFSKFSGGERAKSMYIPLFASCYAKLNLARDNALRIIALDEAFAGVDEDNIREMFGILKYLDLDFVINSQVLWGDYDTIDDLSICELIRPQNSQVVTVERYRWNGHFKEIIGNRKEYNEDLENA